MLKRNLYRKTLTLLEALITASLFVVVGLAVYSAANNGIKIWQRLNKTYIEEDVNIFLEKFSTDLRNSFKYKDIDFTGDKESVRFASLVVSRSNLPGLKKGPGQVVYSFNPKEKKITKQEMSLHDIYRENSTLPKELLEDIEHFSLRYYYYDNLSKEYFWTDEWLRDYLPLAVRVDFELDYEKGPYEFKKTISIPTGGKKG